MTDDIPDTGAVFTFGKSRFADNEPSHFFIKNDPIVAISCGDEHSAVICQNGRVFVFGGNAWGQLGLGHKDEVPRPSCVKWLKPHRAQFVACGRAHTVFVTDSHAIYTVGCNEDGQLGTGDTESHSVPQYIELDSEDTKMKQISAGSNHTAVLTESGRVFVCGSNAEGQLGLGEDTRTCLKLTELKFMEKIAFIECGYYHTVFITSKGGVFVTGDNENQKLGIPNTAPNIYVPVVLPTNVPIKGACCGASHTFLLSMDESKILGFGSNMHGQLGLAKEIENVTVPTEIDMDKMFEEFQLKLVACGAMHTAFVTDNGLLYTCGESRHNKLCLEDVDADSSNADETPNQYLPKRVTAMNGYIVDNVACGGCHTLLTATKGSNADFTNNDYSIISQQTRQATITELPPLQKVPGAINKNMELPHTVEDITNSNVNEQQSDNNGNTAVGEDGSINSLEANVSGSNIMNINDLENDNGSIHDIPELNDDGDPLSKTKSEMKDAVNGLNDMAGNAMNSVNDMAGNAMNTVNDMAVNAIKNVNDIADNTMNKLQDSASTISQTVQGGMKKNSDEAKDKVESVESFIQKKTVDLDPKCCDDRKVLELPDNMDEITSTPPPKTPIIQDLLHVPDITQMSADMMSDDGQKSESGSKSENETIPCGSDKSSPQTGKSITAKTQAVMPIVRSEDMVDAMEHIGAEDKEVVVNKLADKGRFSRFFQSIRDKENSCMGKGKVVEETVQETVQKGIGAAEETVHRVEETVETEIRNQTKSQTCTIL